MTLRHNHIRNATANLLTEVCKDIRVEPQLQPLSGETFPRRLQINWIKLELISVPLVFG